jgi:hypothetical protein
MTKEQFLIIEASAGFCEAVMKLSSDVETIHHVSDMVDYIKGLMDEVNFADAAELLASMGKEKSEWYEYDFQAFSTSPKALSSFEDVEKFLN